MDAERDGRRALGHALRGERHARAGDVRAARLHYGRAVHYAERARFGGGELEVVQRAMRVARQLKDEVERAATPGKLIAAGVAGEALLYALSASPSSASPSSASPSSASSSASPSAPGLANLGNTCYMNAAIRCLLAVHEFEPGAHVKSAYAEIKDALQNDKEPTKVQLEALRSAVNEGKNPGDRFGPDEQADMHEFMFAVVEPNPWPFLFTLVATTEDLAGQRDEIKHATSLALQLGVDSTPTSIVELLGKYVQPEPLEGHHNTTRTIRIGETPEVLAVQLVRFTRTKTETRKNDRRVAFEETLDLGPYTESRTEARYDLIAVAIHRGTFGGGHYWAFTKNEEEDPEGWTKYDDECTTRADFEGVQKESNGDSTAYVLVYRRAAIK
jgi:hypothetical protein